MRTVLLSIFIFFVTYTFGQDKDIDSLEQVLSGLADDTTKVDVLIVLGYKYYNSDAQKTLDYSDLAQSISEKYGYKRGILGSEKMRGIAYWIKGDINVALEAYERGLTIAKQLGDTSEIAGFINNIAVVHTDEGEYETSLKRFLEGLRIVENANLPRLKAIYYQNIGDTYKSLDDLKNALKFTSKAMEIFKEIEDTNGIGVCSNNIGEIFFAQKNYDWAIESFRKARKIFESNNNLRGISISTNNIGDSYMQNENFKEATLEYERAIKLFNQLGNKQGIANVMNSLGRLQVVSKQYETAEKSLREGLKLASSAGLKDEEQKLLQTLSYLYENTRAFEKSLEYYKKHIYIKDSLFNLERNKQVVEMQTLFDSEKKERENAILKKEKELNEEKLLKQESRQAIIIAMLVMAFLVIVVISYALNQKLKSNKKLNNLNKTVSDRNDEIQSQSEELNEAYEEIKTINSNLEKIVHNRTERLKQSNGELTEFLYRASHDLKGPLMTLQGLAYVGLKEGENSFEEILKKVGRTTDEMNATLNNLIQVNTARKSDPLMVPVSFEEVVGKISSQREKMIADKNIKLKISNFHNVHLTTDSEILTIILENLIDNAIQYTEKGKATKQIEIGITTENNDVILTVKDEGIGIEADQLDKVFDMFYRGTTFSGGNGLGLYIVKLAVENINGKIQLKSTVGEGTSILVTLPNNF